MKQSMSVICAPLIPSWYGEGLEQRLSTTIDVSLESFYPLLIVRQETARDHYEEIYFCSVTWIWIYKVKDLANDVVCIFLYRESVWKRRRTLIHFLCKLCFSVTKDRNHLNQVDIALSHPPPRVAACPSEYSANCCWVGLEWPVAVDWLTGLAMNGQI